MLLRNYFPPTQAVNYGGGAKNNIKLGIYNPVLKTLRNACYFIIIEVSPLLILTLNILYVH